MVIFNSQIKLYFSVNSYCLLQFFLMYGVSYNKETLLSHAELFGEKELVEFNAEVFENNKNWLNQLFSIIFLITNSICVS